MRNLKFLVVLLVSVSISSVAIGQVVFSEDFESYAAGTDLHHVGGWDGWNDTASASGPVSNEYARSGSNSVEILGSTDLVQIFDAAGGQWEFTAWMYIPSGGTGVTWFIMLNTYSHNGTQDWSVQTQFDLETGQMTSSYDGAAWGNVVYDRWFEVKILIDLEENTVTEYYDGELFTTHQWDDGGKGTIQVVDLFGNGASSVYYDDIELRQVGGPGHQASNPEPADGATGVTFPLLQWEAGDTAVMHDVYLGTSPDLTAADLVSPGQQSLMYFHMLGVTAGETYYWRVDEIEADGTTVHEGEVWSFTATPMTAYSPEPVDGYDVALADTTLAWQPGQGASSHKLYLGTDANAVADRDPNTVLDDLAAEVLSYEVTGLEPGTTYYWAVDEIGAGDATYEGDLWSFSTMPEIAIDDPSLVAWWTFDAGTGSRAVDWSGYGNHGQLRNADWTTPGAVSDTALSLVDNGYVAIENLYYDESDGTEVTVCAWIRTSSSADQYILSFDRNEYYRLEINGNGAGPGQVGWDLMTTDGQQIDYGSTRRVDDGKWHHVCGVFDNGLATIYIDGTPESSTTGGTTFGTGNVRYGFIGRNSEATAFDGSKGGGNALAGDIDDMRIYHRALTQEEILQAMQGNPLLAGSPSPGNGANVDIRNATTLSWAAGETAASHDVYFGTDRDAVEDADTSSAEYQGNQFNTSLSVADQVAFGGGDYYWRVDEIEADGTVHTGYVWEFTVPGYLIVDNFESYSNNVGERVFETWVDGIGFTLPEPGNPGNGTGAAVGHDVWTPESHYYNGLIMEIARPHDGAQAMPLYYDNTLSPFYSEAERTWTTAQNWTVEGVDTLSLWVRGRRANDQEQLYVAIEDSAGNLSVVVNPDPAALLKSEWAQWTIALSDVADAGVNVAAIKKMYIGVGSRTAPAAGGSGVLSIDDIQIIKGQ